MGKLEGKVVFLTGGAGGIGMASAKLFLSEGAKVALVDREPAALEGALSLAADVSKEEDVSRAVEATVKELGGLDVCFANAGIEGTVAPLLQQTVDDFDRVQAVNVRGVFLCMKHAAPKMPRGGSIVATSSVAGFIGSPGLGPYVTSKHALVGLVRVAALELAPLGIRVNSLHPGPVDNRMMRSIEEQASPGHATEVKAGFTKLVPLGRYATNEEIAKMALYLASDDSSYCTGQQFVADGGFLSQ